MQLQKHIATELRMSLALKETPRSSQGDAGQVPEVAATFFRAVREAESRHGESAQAFKYEPLVD
eukprot:380032-Alexandrium_andersonii.AAC.1